MSNILTLSAGKVDTNHRLEGVKKLTQGIRDAIGENINREMEYTIQPGNSIREIAKALGISANVFAASLFQSENAVAPQSWGGKTITYKNGRIQMESGTNYPVRGAHQKAANDEDFPKAAYF